MWMWKLIDWICPRHVFISYYKDDAKSVDGLEKDLKARGFRVWRDKDVQLTARERAIRAAASVVVVLPPSHFANDVKAQCDIAKKNHKRLFALHLPTSELLGGITFDHVVRVKSPSDLTEVDFYDPLRQTVRWAQIRCPNVWIILLIFILLALCFLCSRAAICCVPPTPTPTPTLSPTSTFTPTLALSETPEPPTSPITAALAPPPDACTYNFISDLQGWQLVPDQDWLAGRKVQLSSETAPDGRSSLELQVDYRQNEPNWHQAGALIEFEPGISLKQYIGVSVDIFIPANAAGIEAQFFLREGDEIIWYQSRLDYTLRPGSWTRLEIHLRRDMMPTPTLEDVRQIGIKFLASQLDFEGSLFIDGVCLQ